MSYEVIPKEDKGIKTYVLKDNLTQTEVEIIPSIGNNLIRFEHAGQPFISEPANLESFDEDFAYFKYGSAILFPPNRVSNAQFSFHGREYHLPQNEAPHHLHGEICSKEWKVIHFAADPNKGCYVTSQFKFEDHPEIIEYFPHHLSFQITYRLLHGQVDLFGEISNLGHDEAPFALGFHPYFPIPEGNDKNVILTIPAKEEWPINPPAFVNGLPQKTMFSKNLGQGVTMDQFAPLACRMVSLEEHTPVHCQIDYVNQGVRLTYELDPHQFPFLLIFRPDWSSAISLEPYTCVTDAFNLPWSYATTGGRGIKSKEKVEFKWSLKLEKL